MPKGLEKSLLLKRKLYGTKKHLREKLQEDAKLSLEQRKIYDKWLNNINEIIDICIDRNRF